MVLNPARWTSLLLENDEQYRLAGALFLRALALIYLAAFFSAALEITGLVGEQGILPAGHYLEQARQHFGNWAWLRLPTVFWIDHSDTSLLIVAYAGCALSVLLFLGWRPLLCTVLLFLFYLSLFRVGQLFFNFQWDYLLLEAGLLAIFLTQGPNRLLIFLFHWLLFRLRFLSGISKLLSDDPSWANLTTLQYYFETQPLPHVGAWYAHHLPEPLLRFGTGATLFVEILVPFFIFLPRPFRLFAASATILVQLLIIATSNHNFINLLTIALCLFLLDDRALRWVPDRLGRILQRAGQRHGTQLLARLAVLPLALLIVVSSLSLGAEVFTDAKPPEALSNLSTVARGWGQGNVYHVFPNMQTQRQELTIQGSQDGVNWTDYRFRYKPNTAADRPRFIVPLHPRLDWMMWFVPTQNPAMRTWFEGFLWRLGEGSPTVVGLLANDPFAGQAPRYVRVLAYQFRFTTPEEKRQLGHFWHVDYLGEFPRVPPRIP
jgi:hypothetical protein